MRHLGRGWFHGHGQMVGVLMTNAGAYVRWNDQRGE